MVHNKLPSSISGKYRDRVPTTDAMGLLTFVILNSFNKKNYHERKFKKNVLEMTKKCKLFTNGGLFRSMLTHGSLFGVSKVRICANSDY